MSDWFGLSQRHQNPRLRMRRGAGGLNPSTPRDRAFQTFWVIPSTPLYRAFQTYGFARQEAQGDDERE
jgi:hypothetical protein